MAGGPFREMAWSQRYAQMGDVAEERCAAWLDSQNRGWIPYGLNRPPLKLSMLSEFIRHTPDFLTSQALVEAKGFGRDKLAKIKYANLDALIEWQKHHPVEVFFYDSHEDRSIVVELSALVRAVETSPHVGKGVFDDATPKHYWAFPSDLLIEIGEVHHVEPSP